MIRRLIHAGVRLAIVAAALRPGRTAALPAASDEPRAEAAKRKRRWRRARPYAIGAAAMLVVIGLGGAAVMVSGIVPIKASSGHWAITARVLDFAKTRSVSTHTIGVTVPPLDDPALPMKGAGHYEFGCAPCHGSPMLQQPTIASRLTPMPPDLRHVSSTFDAAGLFYIVKHGIKFAGMPAWPSLRRDDEVWAMVAFLQALPGLDARAYAELAAAAEGADVPDPMDALVPPQDVPTLVRESCARCHGRDGRGRGTSAFPKLAGQQPGYLLGSLEAYARGERHSGIMQPASVPIDREEMRAIAEHYAGMDPGTAEPPADAATIERGRAIATAGLPDQLVPPCVECHGPLGRPRHPRYPRLAGQYAGYLELQLKLFRSGSRGGTPYGPIMRQVATQLTEEQMRAVAAYFASLDPSARAAR